MTTTTISNLPGDLVEEILTRVSSNSVRAVRLTCTKWNALSENQSFRKMHLDREEAAARELGKYRMICLEDNNISLMSAFVNENPSTEFKGELTCLNDSEKVKISQVFHCEGLLLCILKDDTTRVVVWNPYLGHTSWIKATNYVSTESRIKRGERHMYALGYENRNRYKSCHKILMFTDDFRSNDFPGNLFLQCEIYDFDSGLWRDLDVTPQWCIPIHDHGVSVKGNTYWCATNRNGYRLKNHIICFDFTKERFRSLRLLPFSVGVYGFMTLSCVREEKLAVLCDDTYTIEIWITTKIKAEKVCWSIFLKAPTYDWSLSVSFLINEEKKVAMVLGKGGWLDTVKVFGEDGYFDFEDGVCWPCVCSYVPSLVQIKQPERAPQLNNKARKKRKR